jgi:hypothetical protein
MPFDHDARCATFVRPGPYPSTSPHCMPTESQEAEEGGRFHDIAWCPVQYASRIRESAELRLVYSPSVGFTRYAFQVLGTNGQLLLYQRGPDQASSADAALLAGWTDFGVPAYVWRLSPMPAGAEFDSEPAAAGYAAARQELCRALYPLRMRAWANRHLNVEPLVLPPDGGFPLVDAFALDADNAEILKALHEDGSDDATPPDNAG